MNGYSISGLLILILFLSLTGICMADESSRYLAEIKGGTSTIVGEPDGISVITIEDYAPFFNTTEGNTSYSMPVEHLATVVWPLNAAVIVSGDENESVSLVSVENLSLAEEESILTLNITPLSFYDGELLTAFAEEVVVLNTLEGDSFTSTTIVFELERPAPENEPLCCPPYHWLETDRCCKDEGQGNILCYWDRFVPCS